MVYLQSFWPWTFGQIQSDPRYPSNLVNPTNIRHHVMHFHLISTRGPWRYKEEIYYALKFGDPNLTFRRLHNWDRIFFKDLYPTRWQTLYIYQFTSLHDPNKGRFQFVHRVNYHRILQQYTYSHSDLDLLDQFKGTLDILWIWSILHT